MLKSSMLAAQAAQLKELDAIFERDNKEMKSNQAKVVYNDSSITSLESNLFKNLFVKSFW